MEIVTGPESEDVSGGSVHITLYGEGGRSDQIDLYAPTPDTQVFEPSNIDKFTVSWRLVVLLKLSHYVIVFNCLNILKIKLKFCPF